MLVLWYYHTKCSLMFCVGILFSVCDIIVIFLKLVSEQSICEHWIWAKLNTKYNLNWVLFILNLLYSWLSAILIYRFTLKNNSDICTVLHNFGISNWDTGFSAWNYRNVGLFVWCIKTNQHKQILTDVCIYLHMYSTFCPQKEPHVFCTHNLQILI